MTPNEVTYFIKLDRPLGTTEPSDDKRAHSASLYVGTTKGWRVDVRLEEHQSGRGSHMLAKAAEMGIGFKVVMVIPGGHETERAIKNQKNALRFAKRYIKNGGEIVRLDPEFEKELNS